MTMRSNSFVIAGDPSIRISLAELSDGSISVTLTQSGSNVADIRGLFFDVTNPSLLGTLAVTGRDVTGSVFGDEAITAVSSDVNMSGTKLAPFDVGIEFGTEGIGKDDIFTTSFSLSNRNGTALTLDLLSKVDFGVRLASVGKANGQRKDSLKLTGVSTAAPDAIDDFPITKEDFSTSGNLLANDTDADGDTLRVVEVNSVASNVNTQIALASGALLKVNTNGSYLYDPNQKFEYLAVGESAKESFTYRIFDGASGYDTATATVTIEGVNDAPEISLKGGDSASASLNETNAGLTTKSTLTVSDVDTTDLVSPSVSSVSTTGDTNEISTAELLSYLSVAPTPIDTATTTTGTLKWTFNSAEQAFDYLAVNENLILNYLVAAQDDSGSSNDTDTQVVQIKINGTNDAPVAVGESAKTTEDTEIKINVLANDTDVDKTDTLSISRIVNSPTHGTVIINADKTLSYTPTLNYSGSDQLTYEVSDGNGGLSTAVVDLAVEAVADKPELTVDVLQGDRINEVKLRIRSALTDVDGSETLTYAVNGIPTNVTVSGPTTGNGPTVDQIVTLTLPQDRDSKFDVTVTATSKEASNNSQATTTVTRNIDYDATFNDFNKTFTATKQSMWGPGEAFTFNDSRFLGVDDKYNVSFNAVAYGNYSTQVKAGLQSDLKIQGGTVNAILPYNIDFNTFYNRTTDTLLINPLAALTGGSFTTDSPGGSYNLDFIFDLKGTAAGGLDFGDLGKVEFFNTSYQTNKKINLINFDSKTNPSLNIDLPYGLSGKLAFPNINTTSQATGSGKFTSSGVSNNFLTLNLDVDTALADIFLGGVNPFDLEFGIPDTPDFDFVSASLRLELLDLDVNAGANFLQSFALDVDDLGVLLTFEDNTSETLSFGDDFLLNNASGRDTNGDGSVAFTANLLPVASMKNNTDLGFNVGYNFDLLKGSYGFEIAEIPAGSGTFGPVLDLGETFPVAAIDIYDKTFGLSFGEQSVSFAA